MTKLDLQYDLINYTPASAAPPEANFNRIELHTNQELIERDGTVAMRAQLRLVGDPINDLDAAPKQYVDQVMPVGIIMMFGGVTVPSGGRWASCNGAEMESAVWPELFAVIAQNFSPPGTPAGRFHLPNLAERMPLGSTTGGNVTVPVGSTGGSAASVMPLHGHQMDHDHPNVGFTTGNPSANHTHGLSSGEFVAYRPGYGTFGIQGTGVNIDWAVAGITSGVSEWHTHSGNVDVPNHVGRTANEGTADVSRTNLPPYVGVQYVMRVK